MEHFPRYWPVVRGIHRSPRDFPHKGQWRGALIFSLICAWTNGLANNRDAGDLRRHRAHYDVTLMIIPAAAVAHWSTRLSSAIIFHYMAMGFHYLMWNMSNEYILRNTLSVDHNLKRLTEVLTQALIVNKDVAQNQGWRRSFLALSERNSAWGIIYSANAYFIFSKRSACKELNKMSSISMVMIGVTIKKRDGTGNSGLTFTVPS